MSSRTLLLLFVVGLGMPLTWGALLLFTRYVPPVNWQALLIFFALLLPALFCTLLPLITLISSLLTRRKRVSTRRLLRESGLLTLWIVLNLVLQGIHSWNWFTAVVSLAIVVVVEILLFAK
jgi:hypothetical protein